MTNIFSITFLRLLFFCMCSAGFTVGMRNRKRNHQNDTSETDVTNQTNYLNLTCVRAKRPERPKRVQQNKQYDLPQWLKQAKGGKLRKYHRSLFDYYLVFTSGTSKKDIFDNLVFAGGGWHLRFANYSGPGVSTATNNGN